MVHESIASASWEAVSVVHESIALASWEAVSLAALVYSLS